MAGDTGTQYLITRALASQVHDCGHASTHKMRSAPLFVQITVQDVDVTEKTTKTRVLRSSHLPDEVKMSVRILEFNPSFRQTLNAINKEKAETNFAVRLGFVRASADPLRSLGEVDVAGAGSLSLTTLITQHGFARELDLISFFANALNENLLSFFQFIANIFNATIGDL